jgi:hypothetical protein
VNGREQSKLRGQRQRGLRAGLAGLLGVALCLASARADAPSAQPLCSAKLERPRFAARSERRVLRVHLLSGDRQPFLLVRLTAPGPRLRLPTTLPQAPGFQWSYGARLVVLRPDVHMAPGRRGAVFTLRATF